MAFTKFADKNRGLLRSNESGNRTWKWSLLMNKNRNLMSSTENAKPGDIGISMCTSNNEAEYDDFNIIHGIMLQHDKMENILNADKFLEFTINFYKEIMDLAKKKKASGIVLALTNSKEYSGDGVLGDKTHFTRSEFIDTYKLGMLKALQSDKYDQMERLFNSKLD